MNVENIRTLIGVLKTKELAHQCEIKENVDGFEMSQFYYSCGTPSCIAGWSSFLVDGGKISISEVVVENAQEFLGIDRETGFDLFYPSLSADMFGLDDFLFEGVNSEDGWRDSTTVLDWHEITPQEAIITLEKLIETGKVDWTHAVSKSPYKILNV